MREPTQIVIFRIGLIGGGGSKVIFLVCFLEIPFQFTAIQFLDLIVHDRGVNGLQ